MRFCDVTLRLGVTQREVNELSKTTMPASKEIIADGANISYIRSREYFFTERLESSAEGFSQWIKDIFALLPDRLTYLTC